jgi:N utilization substance protein B
MLFAFEASGGTTQQVISSYWRETPGDPEGRDYADAAVRGVLDELTAVDDVIRKASTNWRLERMARVDRNVLRLGSEESGAFVNGVLDRIAEDLGRVDTDR